MRIAIVGATGEVGRMMAKVLEESGIKPDLLDLYASSRSAGTEMEFENRSYTVKELTEASLEEGYDYVMFSAGASVSKKYAPIAAAAGSVVIDNSSAFRMESNIPLVVPEINGYLLKGYRGIVANPNCSTIQMVLSLYKVNEYFGIKTVVVSTYQAVSGAGNKGIMELDDQMVGDVRPRVFARQIHLNVVPQIGDFLESGFTTEEMKMVDETKKILNDNDISVWPTTVRVPVMYGHSEAIMVETRDSFDIDKLREAFLESQDVDFSEDFVTPLEIAGSDQTFVSRLRTFDSRRFLIWNVADNIRVGAATNAVRILKKHLEINS